MLQFWSVSYVCQVCKSHIYFGYVQNFGQYLHLSILGKQWKFPTSSFCLNMLHSYFTQKCIFMYFLEVVLNLALWRKIVQNLLIFVYSFRPNNRTIDFTKTFITQEWLEVESCPTPRWIAFLILYRLVYNIRSRFNELIFGLKCLVLL